MSKQETFKRILSGYYTSHTMLETPLWWLMKKRCYWSLTLAVSNYKNMAVAFKTIDGEFYVKQVYENGAEWHEDIKECAKELGLL